MSVNLYFIIIPIVVILFVGITTIIIISIKRKKQKKVKNDKIKNQIENLANNAIEMTAQEFMAMRKMTLGSKGRAPLTLANNFAGVYILYNKTKKIYYIGQSQKVLNRVNLHFTGKGNGDVYADYKYGNKFTIRIISLEHSGYKSLNELERHIILTYDSFATGYNKTRGNN